MAIVRLNANEPVEIALRFDAGKRVTSRIPDAPDQMMYSLCGDDTIYLPLTVADEITKLGIRKMELFSICKRLRGKVTSWEVKRVGDAQEPEPPSKIEAELEASIAYEQQRKAVSSKSLPPAVSATDSGYQPSPAVANSNAIQHTAASKLMAGALIAAVDAIRETERYAHVHGLELEFDAEDVRAIAATLFIQAAKDPAFLQPQRPNGNAWAV